MATNHNSQIDLWLYIQLEIHSIPMQRFLLQEPHISWGKAQSRGQKTLPQSMLFNN